MCDTTRYLPIRHFTKYDTIRYDTISLLSTLHFVFQDAAGNGGGARGGLPETMTTKDRGNSGISGGAEDDRRLAWPGQGQVRCDFGLYLKRV